MNICGKKLKIFFLFSLFLLSGIFAANTAKAAETLFYETPVIGGNVNDYAGDGTYDFGYIFTTGATTTNITKVKMTSNNNTPTGNSAYLLIRKLSGCGAPLATSSEVVIAATNTEYSFTWPNGGVDVEANTQYIINYFPVGGVRDNVLMRNSNGASGEDRYWWSACSLSLAGNHVFMKAYWDPDWVAPYCGDATCNGSETFQNCPQDCPPIEYCGDEICGSGETFNNCPQDCSSPFPDDQIFFNNQYRSAPQCNLPIRYDTPYVYANSNNVINFYRCENGDCASLTWVASTTVVNAYSLIVKGINQAGVIIPPEAISGNYVYEANLNGSKYHFFLFWGSKCNDIDYINDHLYNGGVYFNSGSATSSFATSSASFNMDAHSIACSEAEWNATSSFLGINGTLLRCETTAGMILIGEGFVNMVNSAIRGMIDGFQYLFPVNLVVMINQSWVKSASSTLPTTMAWLDSEIAANGDITTGTSSPVAGATFTSSTIWGTNLNSNVSSWETWRQRIWDATTFVWWALFLYYSFWKRGQRIFHNLKNSHSA